MAKHTKKVRDLTLLTKKHPAIQALMQKKSAPEIHGTKVWASSYFIMDFLDDNPPPENASILEVGCGWGVLSLYCAKKFNAKVLATDADKLVFPFLKLHAKENGVKVKTKVSRYEEISDAVLAKQDIIVGGDICFWDEQVDALYDTIKRGLKNGVQTIIIADPGRPTFHDLAQRCKRDFRAFLVAYGVSDPANYDGYLLIVSN
ncbi:Ribosomal protein L11 methyltransferase [Halioglobus japonicus]|nr:Ribosomal protein L11 methyltransferase [Halioglobus japonicus]